MPSQCFIGIQRQRVEGKEGQFRAVAVYSNFESLPDNAHVVIRDTIATGSILVKGMQLLLDEAEDRGISIASITVLTLAGSSLGAQKLSKLATTHIFHQHPNCAVFYWGTRCKNPKEHYREFLEYANKELEGVKIDEKARSVLQKMKKESEAALAEYREKLEGKG